MLKQQWKRRTPLNEIQATPIAFGPTPTAGSLDQADFADAIPASVTEHTTKHLAEPLPPKSR